MPDTPLPAHAQPQGAPDLRALVLAGAARRLVADRQRRSRLMALHPRARGRAEAHCPPSPPEILWLELIGMEQRCDAPAAPGERITRTPADFFLRRRRIDRSLQLARHVAELPPIWRPIACGPPGWVRQRCEALGIEAIAMSVAGEMASDPARWLESLAPLGREYASRVVMLAPHRGPAPGELSLARWISAMRTRVAQDRRGAALVLGVAHAILAGLVARLSPAQRRAITAAAKAARSPLFETLGDPPLDRLDESCASAAERLVARIFSSSAGDIADRSISAPGANSHDAPGPGPAPQENARD